jgi:hypothetical protein
MGEIINGSEITAIQESLNNDFYKMQIIEGQVLSVFQSKIEIQTKVGEIINIDSYSLKEIEIAIPFHRDQTMIFREIGSVDYDFKLRRSVRSEEIVDPLKLIGWLGKQFTDNPNWIHIKESQANLTPMTGFTPSGDPQSYIGKYVIGIEFTEEGLALITGGQILEITNTSEGKVDLKLLNHEREKLDLAFGSFLPILFHK